MSKALIPYFIVIFLAFFLILNWNDISWIFNYKAIGDFIGDLFEKSVPRAETVLTEKENSIEIPRIGVNVPLIFPAGNSNREYDLALKKGAVHFKESAFPGQPGQTIILGHSAPAGWPKINYLWIFSDLSKLEKGDEIFIFFENKKYTYRVEREIFLNRGEEIPDVLENSGKTLFLISCWPPGKNLRRIAVEAIM